MIEKNRTSSTPHASGEAPFLEYKGSRARVIFEYKCSRARVHSSTRATVPPSGNLTNTRVVHACYTRARVLNFTYVRVRITRSAYVMNARCGHVTMRQILIKALRMCYLAPTGGRGV